VQVFSCSRSLYIDWHMVVVVGGKCPTPCKREGKLSERGNMLGDMSRRGNVLHSFLVVYVCNFVIMFVCWQTGKRL